MTDTRTLARSYFASGSMQEVSVANSISVPALSELSQSQEWQEEMRLLEREAAIRLKVKLTTIVKSSLDQIADRIENGDYVSDKDGEIYRRPMDAKALTYVMDVALRRKADIESDASGIGSSEHKRLMWIKEILESRGVQMREPKLLEGEIANGQSEILEVSVGQDKEKTGGDHVMENGNNV